MRRLLASMTGLVLLLAVLGCHHVSGTCDCDCGYGCSYNYGTAAAAAAAKPVPESVKAMPKGEAMKTEKDAAPGK